MYCCWQWATVNILDWKLWSSRWGFQSDVCSCQLPQTSRNVWHLKHSCLFKTLISFVTGIRIRPSFSIYCVIFLVMSVFMSVNHPVSVRKNEEWNQVLFLTANLVLSFQSCLFVQVAWLWFYTLLERFHKIISHLCHLSNGSFRIWNAKPCRK